MTVKMKRLICIDDDPLALDQIRKVLGGINVPLTTGFYGSPSQALEAHKAAPADLVLTDLRMGATTGLELVREMQAVAPDTIYMLLSGEADLQSALIAMNQVNVFRFFTKPAEKEELEVGFLDAIRELNLRQMRKITTSTLSAVEQLNTAIATIDISGRILYANDHARDILDRSGFFDATDQSLIRSLVASQTAEFQAFLKALAYNRSDSSSRSIFRFTHPESHAPLIVSAILDAEYETAGLRFNLVLSDPMRADVTTPHFLQTALNISFSEARVVHGLVEGGSIDEAAHRAGVSQNTARTYIKNVFAKTGVSKQAELVRLALMSAA